MKYVKLFEEFTSNVNEGRRGTPKMYVKYMAVIKKIRELEDEQKELAAPYFDAKESGDKEKMKSQLELMKKNQSTLDSFRRNLASIEDKYINNMDYFPGE